MTPDVGYSVLDVLDPDPEDGDEEFSRYVESLLEQRSRARQEKDYTRADEIRRELESKDVILEDSAQGTRWKRKV